MPADGLGLRPSYHAPGIDCQLGRPIEKLKCSIRNYSDWVLCEQNLNLVELKLL